MHEPVTADDLAAYLGRGSAPANAQEAVDVTTVFVEAFTRGNGFNELGHPNRQLAAVIKSAAARLVNNPDHAKRQQTGPFAITPAVLDGFTLPELAVLHRYRKRAA